MREQVPAGWRLADLDCTAEGASTAAIDLAAATAEIDLVAGRRITCTYVNEFDPPAGDLFLRKLTRDGIGSFDFTVRPVGGGTRSRRRRPPRMRASRWTPSRAR